VAEAEVIGEGSERLVAGPEGGPVGAGGGEQLAIDP